MIGSRNDPVAEETSRELDTSSFSSASATQGKSANKRSRPRRKRRRKRVRSCSSTTILIRLLDPFELRLTRESGVGMVENAQKLDSGLRRNDENEKIDFESRGI